jgi:hypothetical protein
MRIPMTIDGRFPNASQPDALPPGASRPVQQSEDGQFAGGPFDNGGAWSDVARQYLQRDRASKVVPRGTLTREELRAVLYRLKTDFYDNGEVLDRIAHRVVSDLP